MSSAYGGESDLPLRVACVGGSVTHGLGLPNRREECYPAVLERLLATHSRPWRCVVRNFGYSGAAVTRGSNEPYWKTPSFHGATRFRPHAVVLILGVNDAQYANAPARDSLEHDFGELIDHFAAPVDGRPASVLVGEPPPVFPPHTEIDLDTLERVVRPAIRRVALLRGAPQIDFYTPLADARDDFPDRLHPNARAACRMAEVACEALLPVLDAWRGAGVT